jgi:hypothetical protein
MSSKHLLACHCCGSHTLHENGAYEICSVCGWEDDPAQSADPDLRGGANKMSLHQARAAWREKQAR